MRLRATKVVDPHGRPYYVSSTPRMPFEGGGTGRRWAGLYSATHSLNSALLASHRVLVARARTLLRNHPTIAPALKKRVANVVGCRIRPQHHGRTDEERQAIGRAWDWWETRECDAYGRTNLTGILRLMTYLAAGDGEAFARLRFRRPVDGLLVPLQVQTLTTDSVPAELHDDRRAGRVVRAGIEFDALDRRAAYHIYRQRPTDTFGLLRPGANLETTRVEAREVMHLHELEDAGQVRGVPVLARGMLRAHDADLYDDAQLKRQQMAAMFAGFVTRNGTVDPLDEVAEDQGKTADEPLEWETGALVGLGENEDIKFPDIPSMGGDYDAAMRRYDRQIAEAIGVPPWALDGLYEKVNFTSSRVAFMDFRRLWRIEVAQQLVPMVCQPLYEAWLDTAVGSGALKLPDYERDRRDFLMIPWRTEGYEWVEPLKEATAAEKRIQSGQTTQTDILAALGIDLEAYIETRARELRLAAEAGITLTSHVTPAEAASPAPVPSPGPGATRSEDAADDDAPATEENDANAA